MNLLQKIIKLTKQLYPTGRAFRIADNSFKRRMHEALAKSEVKAIEDSRSTLDSTLADNENYTTGDATSWERRLGLISNPAVDLEDRKLAINRKYNHPGTIPARSNFRYIEGQLRAAGFNVYVTENRFPDGLGGYVTKTPEEFSGEEFPKIQLGDAQLGDFQLGDTIYNLCVNNLDENIDAQFNIGGSFVCTFFISDPYGQYADVPAIRKDEFRQLILKAKQTQAVAILIVNYI